MFDVTKAILGIDPGTLYTGWALIDYDLNLLTHGLITLPNNMNKDLRIITAVDTIKGLLHMLSETYDIDAVGIEAQYVGKKNPSSAITLSRLVGALMYVVYKELRSLPELVLTTKAIKLTGMTPYKRNIAEQLSRQYSVEFQREDEAYALLIALATAKIRSSLPDEVIFPDEVVDSEETKL